jgi:transcriptional regulator with XRE-family HTH domain
VGSNSFGEYIKTLRVDLGMTLRDFCMKNGIDAGNYSRLERGVFPAPHKDELLEKYALALGCVRGSDEWFTFFDTAAASRGEIPSDLKSDAELMEKLPVLFRTLRGSQVDPSLLDKLADRIRKN